MVWIIPQFFKKMFYFLEKVKSLFSHSPLSVLFLLSGLDSASQQAGLNNCQRIFFFFQRILTVDSCLVAEWLALASNGNRAWALESHRLSLGNKPTTYIFLAKCLYIFLKFFLMGTIFEVFIEFVPMFFVLCFAFLATRHVDLGSPTRDRIHTPCTGRRSLNQWTSREVPLFMILVKCLNLFEPQFSFYKTSRIIHINEGCCKDC